MNDSFSLTGKIHLVHTDGNGNILTEIVKDNLVVQAGKNLVALMLTATQTPFTYTAVGTGSTAPAIGDTALGAEIGRVSDGSATASAGTATFVSTFGAGTATGTWQEAGLFNAASSGTMLSRVTYSAVTKGASDSITITWTVTQN